MSKILIAIPAFNAIENIDITLASCLSQTKSSKIIISDNSSTDGTYEHVVSKYHQYPNISIVKTPRNLGRTGNWNFLLEEFFRHKETFIKFLFTGEELMNNCIEECEKVIDQHPDVAAIAFEYFFRMGNSETISSEKLSGRLSPREVDRLNLVEGGFLGSIVSHVYSKEAIGKHRFNNNFVGKTDFDFAVLTGHPAYYIKMPLAISNVASRRTFYSALDYWFEAESAFNRSYWLEKEKSRLTKSEYNTARFKILADFVERNGSYYTFYEFISLLRIVYRILWQKCLKKIRSVSKKLLLLNKPNRSR
jgi:glycosyltransferase involved in cell wall biosynthesis